MRKTLTHCLLLLTLAGAATAARADNLVTNGSFETGDFTGWSGTTTTDINSYVTQIDGINQASAYAGTYFALLGTFDATSTLSETLATVVGDTYQIQFALANDEASGSGYLNSFLASFGNTTLLSETNATASGYTLYTLDAVATSTSTALSFTNRNDAGDFDLDDVSVSTLATPAVTPEPSSFALLGSGVLGAVGMLRRRRSA